MLLSTEEQSDTISTNQLTVCLRLQPRYDANIRLFDDQNFNLVFNNLNKGFGHVTINKYLSYFDLGQHELSILKWHHVCFSVDQDVEKLQQSVFLNIDGITFLDVTNDMNDTTDLDMIQLKDPIKLGGQGRKKGLFGNLADMNIWNRSLTEDEVLSFTKNKISFSLSAHLEYSWR